MHISEKQQNSVTQTREKYSEIIRAINLAESKVLELNESRIHMDKMRQEVETGIHQLVALSERNSVSTGNVSSSVQEQTASIEEISAASDQLDSLAQNLKELVKVFHF